MGRLILCDNAIGALAVVAYTVPTSCGTVIADLWLLCEVGGGHDGWGKPLENGVR